MLQFLVVICCMLCVMNEFNVTVEVTGEIQLFWRRFDAMTWCRVFCDKVFTGVHNVMS